MKLNQLMLGIVKGFAVRSSRQAMPRAYVETMEGRTLMSANPLASTAVCPSDPSLQDGTSNTIMYAEKYVSARTGSYSPSNGAFFLRNSNPS